jgi:hypothetical protein
MFKKVTTAAVCAVLASAMIASGAIAAGGGGGKVARGHTGQGRSIRVIVSQHHIRLRGFSIQLHCSGGYVLIDQESNFLPSAVDHKGRFHDTQVGSTDEILIRGHLRGDKVTGRVRVRDRLGKHKCSSPWVKFKAHPRGDKNHHA